MNPVWAFAPAARRDRSPLLLCCSPDSFSLWSSAQSPHCSSLDSGGWAASARPLIQCTLPVRFTLLYSKPLLAAAPDLLLAAASAGWRTKNTSIAPQSTVPGLLCTCSFLNQVWCVLGSWPVNMASCFSLPTVLINAQYGKGDCFSLCK